MASPDSSDIQTGRHALRRWSADARAAAMTALGLQMAGVFSWIAISWGIGHGVGTLAAGGSAEIYLLVAAAGTALRSLTGWGADQAVASAGMRMVGAARDEILGAAASAGPALLGGDTPGARTAQIVDRTHKLSGYASNWLPGMRLALAGPLLILFAAATQTWLAATLLLISVLVLPLFIWLTAGETASRARAQQASLDHLSGAFQARAAQSGLIRAFRAVGRETEILRRASEDLRQRTMSILRVAFLSTAVLEFFASVSIALVAVYVGFKLLGVFPFETGETLTLSEGLTVLILAPEFFAPIRKLSSLHHDRADAVAAADMLAPWVAKANTTGITRLPKQATAPIITFEKVSLTYASGHVAVSNVSFTAQPGTLCGLSGPSGAGKSSCLLALLARVQVASGTILINDTPLRPGESLAESIAYVGQTPWVVEGTIRENLTLSAQDASSEEIGAAARQAGLTDLLDRSGRTLDQQLGRFGTGLSGGQRQRVALARALLRQAPILLLDEPTAHLDPEAETDFITQLKTLAKERTILIATHSEALLAACDQTVEIDKTDLAVPA